MSDDLFDSDEDQPQQQSQKQPLGKGKESNDDSDDLFGSSDDEEENKISQTKRLGAGRTTKAKTPVVDNDDDDDLFASSSDEEDIQPKKKIAKRKSSDVSDDDFSPAGKRKVLRGKKAAPKKAPKKKTSSAASDDDNGDDDSDAYDSGPEAVQNSDDEDFLGEESQENVDIMKEYKSKTQKFNDQRPPKKHSKMAGGPINPMDETLAILKRQKRVELTQEERDNLVSKLHLKMEIATNKDRAAVAEGKPALHKLNLLPLVQQAVSMKSLHTTLLEKMFLCYLRDWIEPRDATILPAHAVRVAVYDMLASLPITPEYLKMTRSSSIESSNGKSIVVEDKPIGVTIVALRKHKMETPENKRKLKDLMDTWSRPLFGKESVGFDTRERLANDVEVQRAMLNRLSNEDKLSGRRHDDLLSSKSTAGPTDEKDDRARAPNSAGYIFTMVPESNVTKAKVDTNEARKMLSKKLSERGIQSATGKKSNPRAITISVSGPSR